MKVGIAYDVFFEKHLTGSGHPEQPARTARIYKELAKTGLLDDAIPVETRACDEEILKFAHQPAYLAQAKKDIQQGLPTLTTGDTQVCKDSWEVSLRATGSAVCAVEQIIKGKMGRAFCLTRPPGHHATPVKGMGFCLFNHVAVAARYAQKRLGVGKVLIVDWDVHHGNGTQDIFYDDDSVFFLSSHQAPWYPGTGGKDETGKGKGLGYTLNFPLPAGSGRTEVVDHAFGENLSKRMQSFKPELIIISAGFDSRKGDPLGQFQLEDKDFSDLTAQVSELAKEHANGHIVSVLEGGYDLNGLAKASTGHFKALLRS